MTSGGPSPIAQQTLANGQAEDGDRPQCGHLSQADGQGAVADAAGQGSRSDRALITEIGNSAHNYCELSGRTMPTAGDVSLALINMGLPITGIDLYMRREAHKPIAPF